MANPEETWQYILDQALSQFVSTDDDQYQPDNKISKYLIDSLIGQNYNKALKKFLEQQREEQERQRLLMTEKWKQEKKSREGSSNPSEGSA